MINPVNKRHLDKLEEYVYKAMKRDELDLERIN